MLQILTKWTGAVAALCLLCCAAPLGLAFLGGGSVAASALLAGDREWLAEILLLAGITIMAFAAWAMLRRRSKSGPTCDLPEA